MMWLSLLGLLPPVLLGMGMVFLVWPVQGGQIPQEGPERPDARLLRAVRLMEARRHLLLKSVLGVLLGLGVDACLFFFWGLAFGMPGSGLAGWEIVGLELGLAALAWVAAARRVRVDGAPTGTEPEAFASRLGIGIDARGLLAWSPAVVFAAALGLFTAAFVVVSYLQPYGDFDAYAMWNLRARIMVADPANWRSAFSPLYDWIFHADYPLLVPLNVARLWFLLGEQTTRAPIVVAGVFTLSIAGLLFAALAAVRDPVQATVGGLVALGTPWLLQTGMSQIAEAPLAAYILAALVGLALYSRRFDARFLALAGLAAGLAGWTKNEGILFAAAFSATVVGLAWLCPGERRGLRPFLQVLWPYLAGLALPLATVAVFKNTLAPANDLFADRQFSDMLALVLDGSRYAMIFNSFGQFALDLGGWSRPVLLLLAGYLALTWRRLERCDLIGLGAMAAALLITLAGYFAVYLVTPHPLDWHLKYSADRLLFQLFPGLVFVVFFAAKSPLEAGREMVRGIKDKS